MKIHLGKVVVLGLLLAAVPLFAAAALVSYKTQTGDTISKVAGKLGITPAQFVVAYPNAVLQRGQTFTSGTATPPPPPVTPPTIPPPAAGEVHLSAYTTGYGYPDNTPAGNAISDGVIHSGAGGSGSYADPITLAVGHSIVNGKDILDYAAGTKFYVPNLRKYFIVEDTCGDGNSPQNGPCHTGYQGHVWLDLWVGGQGLSKSGTLACEDTITDLHLVILNPASTYTVVSGPVYNGSCAQQFGDTVI